MSGRSLVELAGLGLLLLVALSADPVSAQVLEPLPGAGGESGQPAEPWKLETIDLAGEPVAITVGRGRKGLGGVRLQLESGEWLRLEECASGICTAAVSHSAESGRTGGADIAEGSKSIRRAWLAEPKAEFVQAPKGRTLAGALMIANRTGGRERFGLDAARAFVGVPPRIADLNGDGEDEVLTVLQRSDGAALAVVAFAGAGLSIDAESAAEAPAADALAPFAIADFDSDRKPDIALIAERSGEATLELWRYGDHRLERLRSIGPVAAGVSNGAVDVLATTCDCGGAQPFIVVADAARQTLRLISFEGGEVAEPARIALPAAIEAGFVVVTRCGRERPSILIGLAGQKLAIVE